MTRRWIAVAACACVCGCGGENPGGNPPVRVLAPGELAEPVPIETSWISFELRSAVLGQSWAYAGLPGTYYLELLERAGGCGALGETTVGPGSNSLGAYTTGLGDGTCVPGVPCDATVTLGPAQGGGIPATWLYATAGSLTLSRPFDGWELAGELHAWFPRDPEFELGSDRDGEGYGSMLCVSVAGRFRRCELSPEVLDCCNEAKPLDEWVIPFEAPLCSEAIDCFPERPCGGEMALACPVPEAATDCDIACRHAVELCRVAYECEDGEWICTRFCDPVSQLCPATCAATSNFPAFGTAFSCLEANDTADGWTSCMAACGDSP